MDKKQSPCSVCGISGKSFHSLSQSGKCDGLRKYGKEYRPPAHETLRERNIKRLMAESTVRHWDKF